MPQTIHSSTGQKALAINLDEKRYGTFAEIGAGQEVARHFFQAGRASQTVAKTISAYDMTFSDEIYGKSGRYVCEERLIKMLDHEFDLLVGRLKKKRGDKTAFFAFADTVATSSSDSVGCHGWMGIRFQNVPGGPTNDIILHVRGLDRNRLQQQEAIGLLGVNLIHAAFYHLDDVDRFLLALGEDIGSNRVEVDMVKMSGPDTAHFDNRIVSLEMVRLGLTDAAVFNSQGQVTLGREAFYQKPILVHRGTFRPITKTNVEILEKANAMMASTLEAGSEPTLPLLEISTKNLSETNGQIDQKDFLDRVDTICALNHSVMISNFSFFYELKQYLRHCTDQQISMVIGASHLEKLFFEKYYENLPGGILEAFGLLFDRKTKIYVYPFKTELICSTAQTFNPETHLRPLFQYLIKNEFITDIIGCDNVDTSVHSSDVRKLLAAGDKRWESLVPAPARDIIKANKFFGLK